MVYTIEGKWKYIEHDWVAGPGSLVYETAASTHTLTVVAEGESGHMVTLVTMSGDLLFLDEKNNIVALENWKRRCNAILPIASSMASSRKTSRHSTDLDSVDASTQLLVR